MAIESLAQQAATFVDSLSIKPAATEKNADEYSQEVKTPLQGDTVTISEEARALVAMENPGESNQSDEETDMDQTIQTLKNQIEKLEERDIPEKQKLTQIQDKETRLMELREQLLKAQQTKLKADGQSETGGTKAKGFGNSVKDF